MRSLRLCAVLLFGGLLLLASLPLAARAKEACPYSADPYASCMKRASGAHAGSYLNADAVGGKRNVRTVERLEEAIVVANFHHDGCYWLARIPTTRARDWKVFYEVEDWKYWFTGGHGQVRVSLGGDDRMVIVPQPGGDPGCLSRSEERLQDFVLSVEAWHVTGEAYSIQRGTMDEYELVLRMMSLEHVRKKAADSARGIVATHEWLLDLSPRRKQGEIEPSLAILDRALIRGQAWDAPGDVKYHTFLRNCVTESLSLLDVPQFGTSIPYSKEAPMLNLSRVLPRHFEKAGVPVLRLN